MKIYKLLITIILLSFISCKENNNQIDHHSASTLINKTSSDTLIIKNEPIIVFLFPSEKEIKKIKREKGEDNFFTIADDENSYRANINEILADENYKTKITESGFIKFNDNKIFDKSKVDNKWSVIIYANGKTWIVSSVDLFMALSKLKENNSKIDYNSILKSINDNLLNSENSSNISTDKNAKTLEEFNLEKKGKYSILKETKCDINQDNIEDEIFVYKNNKEFDSDDDTTKQSPVVIFLGIGNNKFEKSENPNIFANDSNDFFKNLVVKDNFFTVELNNEVPDKYVIDKYITFKYDKKSKSIILFKYGQNSLGDKNEKLLYTSKDFGKIYFEQYDSNTILEKVSNN